MNSFVPTVLFSDILPSPIAVDRQLGLKTSGLSYGVEVSIAHVIRVIGCTQLPGREAMASQQIQELQCVSRWAAASSSSSRLCHTCDELLANSSLQKALTSCMQPGQQVLCSAWYWQVEN